MRLLNAAKKAAKRAANVSRRESRLVHARDDSIATEQWRGQNLVRRLLSMARFGLREMFDSSPQSATKRTSTRSLPPASGAPAGIGWRR
jgi:hypothetical protein